MCSQTRPIPARPWRGHSVSDGLTIGPYPEQDATTYSIVRGPAQTCVYHLAASFARVLHRRAPQRIRGRREDRMLVAPAASCATKKAHELENTGSTGATGLPCAMVLTALCVLSPVSVTS
jgi:hypothetical protein